MNGLKSFFKTIYNLTDLIPNKTVRNNLLLTFPIWIAAFIGGSIAVFYTLFFSWAETGVHAIFKWDPHYLLVLTPACFILGWWLVRRFSPESAGSGIPQVMASIELSQASTYPLVKIFLGTRQLVIKIVSSVIMVLGGGVIGREGPTIQITASVFKVIYDWLPDGYPKVSRLSMLVTGASAGLAAAFNTPLGGIVFAIEELTRTHINLMKSTLLTGVIIAGLTALAFWGPYLYLGSPDFTSFSFSAIGLVIPLAILTGLAGAGTGKMILKMSSFRTRLKSNWKMVVFVGLCGLAVALMGLLLDFSVLGSGKSIMVNGLFTDDKYLDWQVALARITGQVLSSSTGAAGGVFAPSLSAGAGIGAVLSGWLQLTPSESNLMMVCGMTGFLTGITRSPFTAAILVLEMSDSHAVIFYLLITALLSNLTSMAISPVSFYQQIRDQFLKQVSPVPDGK